jgi:hypothetical protein
MLKKSKKFGPLADIERLVVYLWHDEEKHFDGERDHIFRSVRRVAAWLDELKNTPTTDCLAATRQIRAMED